MTSTQTSLSLELYRDMLRIRMIEEAIAHRYREQKMRCPVHLSIGQEAVAVGVCKATENKCKAAIQNPKDDASSGTPKSKCKAALHLDFLISNHRAHAHYLAKGGDLKAMMAEIYGKATGCCRGRGGSMHLIDRSVGMLGSTPIVGGSMPVGIGLAFATHLKQEKNITIIFFGEGSTEEGVFGECLNFAALKKLPVLFVCENNFYSVYSPLDVRQPAQRDRIAIARAHGIKAEIGYGNDVEEVYRIAQEAVSFIRAGNGPVFLEFDTYRHREHCGPNFDNNIGYRTEEEFLHWEKKCPLKLQAQRIEADLEALRAPIVKEIEEAFAFAESSPFPSFDPEKETPYA